MRIHPALAALERDDAPQRRAQLAAAQARDAWTASADVAPVAAELERYGNGAALSRLPALQALMRSGADRFARGHLARFLALAAEAPLVQWPVRHVANAGMASLLLARSGRASVSLVAYEPCRAPPPHATFSHGERHETVLAGEGSGLLVRLRDGRLREKGVALGPGARFTLDVECETLLPAGLPQRVVVLRLSRGGSPALPAREYDRASGQLVHQAAGSLADSRREMMATLLARMGRAEAAPVLRAMSRNGADHLRWQALRELLSLDTAQGWAALLEIAERAGDPLQPHAKGLQAQLLDRHPELGAREAALCPA